MSELTKTATSKDELCPDDDQFSMVTDHEAPANVNATLESNKFMGQKERRKSSIVKMFMGDYLSLSVNQGIAKIMAKHGIYCLNLL